MDALSLLQALLLRRALAAPDFSRTDLARTDFALSDRDAADPRGPTDTPTAQEPDVANEFEFLDKHYDPTDLPEVAAQTALERFGNYPNAHTSTVIFGISWQTLTDSIRHAVLNFNNAGIFSTSVAATLSQDARQWQIVITGLRFVNATRSVVDGTPQYVVSEYSNGSVFVNAEALGAQLLGDVVHLSTGFGNWVQDVQLKNPPSY